MKNQLLHSARSNELLLANPKKMQRELIQLTVAAVVISCFAMLLSIGYKGAVSITKCLSLFSCGFGMRAGLIVYGSIIAVTTVFAPRIIETCLNIKLQRC